MCCTSCSWQYAYTGIIADTWVTFPYHARMAPALQGLDFSPWFQNSLMGLFLHIVSTVGELPSCGAWLGFFLGSFSNSESLENSLRLRKLQSGCFPSAIFPPSSGSFRAKWSRDVSLLFNYNFNYSTRPRVSLETILLDFFKTLTVKTGLWILFLVMLCSVLSFGSV